MFQDSRLHTKTNKSSGRKENGNKIYKNRKDDQIIVG